ncbi:MAG: hypothetical protein IKH31_05280 [Clostridia bacterium]|nr:hypothetical protein [Clostridia bacterium]
MAIKLTKGFPLSFGPKQAPLDTGAVNALFGSNITAGDVWYSFDTVSLTNCIVPDAEVFWEERGRMYSALDAVRGALKKAGGAFCKGLRFRMSGDPKKRPWARCSVFLTVSDGANEYLASFNRLWFDGESIHNALGHVQFVKYPKGENANFAKEGDTFIACPESGGDGAEKDSGPRRVLNAPFIVNSDAGAIAEAFMAFINDAREGE